MLIVQVTASKRSAVAVGRVTQVTDRVTVVTVTDRVITVTVVTATTVTQVTRTRTVVPATATTTIPGNFHSTAYTFNC
jgi:hypothetical protein